MLRPDLLSHDLIPERDLVVHRSDELNEITQAFDPVLDGRAPMNLFLFGPSGVGKTMTARIAVDELEQEAAVSTSYVNCWETYERNDLLYTVTDELLTGETIHRQSTSRTEWLEKLGADPQHPRIVILDEVDQLEDKKVLYELHEKPALSLVCIANREEGLFSGMDKRTRSRVVIGNRIEFDDYSTSQLASILKKRIEQLSLINVVSDRQFERIGSSSNGDARIAITTLRLAIEAARSTSGRTDVTNQMIAEAVDQAENVLRLEHLDRLNDFQQTLYEIVEDREPVSPGDIYDEYSERAVNPKTKRTIRSHLGKMVQYHIIVERGSSQKKRYLVR